MSRVTIRDLNRFRALARAGVCRANAARAIGQTAWWGAYWAHRMHVDFPPAPQRCYTDAGAIARLRATWRALEMQRQNLEAVAWLMEWSDAP